MIAIGLKEINDIILGELPAIRAHLTAIRPALDAFANSQGDPMKKKYVVLISSLGEKLVTADPEQLKKYQADFDDIIKPTAMKRRVEKTFRNDLLAIMDYSGLRSSFYPGYFHKVGIKACVYCNALLTVTVERETGVIQAKFQCDHYRPKNEYPCFSISLYNLYPVCANCNNVKGVKRVAFDLYADLTSPTQAFQFKLRDGCKGKFLLSGNIEDLEIDFKEPVAPKDHETFNKLFAVRGIYATQKDVAAELILKAATYTEAYRETLRISLPELFRDRTIINRLLAGNYTDEAENHKRPLAKFTRDIALQLGLIKKDDA
jgi:hypothetical protein